MVQPPRRRNDALDDFTNVLARADVEYNEDSVVEDFLAVHDAASSEVDEVKMIDAIAHEINIALRDPASYGRALEHQLTGLRRASFGVPQGPGVLRLVFAARDRGKPGIRIVAFGQRRGNLGSIYYRVKLREI